MRSKNSPMQEDENGNDVVPIIRPLKRSDPDLRKLARALIALAVAQNKAKRDAHVARRIDEAEGDKTEAEADGGAT